MTPSLLILVVPAVASAIGLPILGAPQPPDLAGIERFAGQFATATAAALTSVSPAVIDVARIVYVTCLLVGVLLYFSHLGRRLGKDLVIGGVLVVVVSEYVIPAVTVLSR